MKWFVILLVSRYLKITKLSFNEVDPGLVRAIFAHNNTLILRGSQDRDPHLLFIELGTALYQRQSWGGAVGHPADSSRRSADRQPKLCLIPTP